MRRLNVSNSDKQAQIENVLREMEEARKKLSGNAAAEGKYAEAYKKLTVLDPTRFRPLRKKYR